MVTYRDAVAVLVACLVINSVMWVTHLARASRPAACPCDCRVQP